MLMASLRESYAGVLGSLAASQLQLHRHLMMQSQAQQQPLAHPAQMRGPPLPPHVSPPPPPPAPPLGALGPHAPHPALAQMDLDQEYSDQGPGGQGAYPPSDCHSPPISRTYTYKKVTKPLLERKRRARINRCLDELKELMVGALEAEGENVSKLEKADILELTVRHLQRITRSGDPTERDSRFQAGFSQCASEACHFLLGLPGLDAMVGQRLVAHLSQVVNGLRAAPPTPSPSSPSPDLLLGAHPHPLGPHPDVHLPRTASSPSPPPGPGSPSLTASPRSTLSPLPEVSSTTWDSGLNCRRSRKRDVEDLDQDQDGDSDVPVNYTSEALRERKHPRLDVEVVDTDRLRVTGKPRSATTAGAGAGAASADSSDSDCESACAGTKSRESRGRGGARAPAAPAPGAAPGAARGPGAGPGSGPGSGADQDASDDEKNMWRPW